MMLESLVHRALLRTPAKVAHKTGILGMMASQKFPFYLRILEEKYSVDDARLKTNLCNIVLPNPIILAAGLDKNAQVIPYISALGFGAITIGSVTMPSHGNKEKVLRRIPEDMSLINSLGLPSKGPEYVSKKIKKSYPNSKSPLIVNVAPTNKHQIKGNLIIKDMIWNLDKIIEKAGYHFDFVELNLSCGNTIGGRKFEYSLEAASDLISEVKKAKYNKPIIAKISPDTIKGDFLRLIGILLDSGVDILNIGNASTDPSTREKLSNPKRYLNSPGALSGNIIYEMQKKRVALAYKETNMPIIATGGASPENIVSLHLAGASAVGTLTGFIYRGPSVVRDMNIELLSYLDKENCSLKDIIGKNSCQESLV